MVEDWEWPPGELDIYDVLGGMDALDAMLQDCEQHPGRWPKRSYYRAHLREARRMLSKARKHLEDALPHWEAGRAQRASQGY